MGGPSIGVGDARILVGSEAVVLTGEKKLSLNSGVEGSMSTLNSVTCDQALFQIRVLHLGSSIYKAPKMSTSCG